VARRWWHRRLRFADRAIVIPIGGWLLGHEWEMRLRRASREAAHWRCACFQDQVDAELQAFLRRR
jgi:hypothetical protein